MIGHVPQMMPVARSWEQRGIVALRWSSIVGIYGQLGAFSRTLLMLSDESQEQIPFGSL